jgi:hypothetical protein
LTGSNPIALGQGRCQGQTARRLTNLFRAFTFDGGHSRLRAAPPSGSAARRRPRRSIRLDVSVALAPGPGSSPESSLRSAFKRRMSAASRPGRGTETTSANAVRNSPASVSGNFIRSSGTTVGRRIMTEFSDRNLPRSSRPYVENATVAVSFRRRQDFCWANGPEVVMRSQRLLDTGVATRDNTRNSNCVASKKARGRIGIIELIALSI